MAWAGRRLAPADLQMQPHRAAQRHQGAVVVVAISQPATTSRAHAAHRPQDPLSLRALPGQAPRHGTPPMHNMPHPNRGYHPANFAGLEKNLASLIAEVVPATAAGRPLEIWFADEARVGQQGTLTYVWAR